jgi:hypothetical protein
VRSDLDLFVIVSEPWVSSSAQLDTVALRPDTIPIEVLQVDGRRWDVEYWLESQVDQLFEKFAPAELAGDQPAGQRMTFPELGFLLKLLHAAPVAGDEWLAARHRQIDESSFGSVFALRSFHMMDLCVEDAVGQLAEGDVESAVLATKLAFYWAVDGLLASHGEPGDSSKWLARRFRAAQPAALSFDDYWAIETRREYEPDDPRRWIEKVLALCQHIATEVPVG